jgi:hypothetical protein
MDAGSSNTGIIAAIIVVIFILGLAVCILVMYRKGMISIPCLKVKAERLKRDQYENKDV